MKQKKQPAAPSERNKALLLALSDIAFRNAEALLRYVINSKVSEDDEAYPGLVAGVVVTYARPFTNSYGLGPLPKEFSQVPIVNGNAMQDVHDWVMSMRHKLYAHYELDGISEMTRNTPGIRDPREIHLEFNEVGFSIETNEIRTPTKNLPLIGMLLATQSHRINVALTEHLHGWLGKLPTKGAFYLANDGLLPVAQETPPFPPSIA